MFIRICINLKAIIVLELIVPKYNFFQLWNYFMTIDEVSSVVIHQQDDMYEHIQCQQMFVFYVSECL